MIDLRIIMPGAQNVIKIKIISPLLHNQSMPTFEFCKRLAATSSTRMFLAAAEECDAQVVQARPREDLEKRASASTRKCATRSSCSCQQRRPAQSSPALPGADFGAHVCPFFLLKEEPAPKLISAKNHEHSFLLLHKWRSPFLFVPQAPAPSLPSSAG